MTPKVPVLEVGSAMLAHPVLCTRVSVIQIAASGTIWLTQLPPILDELPLFRRRASSVFPSLCDLRVEPFRPAEFNSPFVLLFAKVPRQLSPNL